MGPGVSDVAERRGRAAGRFHRPVFIGRELNVPYRFAERGVTVLKLRDLGRGRPGRPRRPALARRRLLFLLGTAGGENERRDKAKREQLFDGHHAFLLYFLI